MTRVVTGALEVERRDKRIGAALEAAPRVYIADPDLLGGVRRPRRRPRCSAPARRRWSTATGRRTPSASTEVAGVAVEPLPAEGRKCARSWRILPEVGADPRYPDLSLRDADAVAWWDARAWPIDAPSRS